VGFLIPLLVGSGLTYVVRPPVLCLNESKIDEMNLNRENIKAQLSEHFPEKLQFWNCCKPPNKGYAGTAILIHKDYQDILGNVKVNYDIGINKHDQEGRVVTAEFDWFTLVAVYVPNAGVDGLKRLNYRTREWDVDFQAYLNNLEKRGKPVVICGDLNVAHHEIDIFGPKGKERRAGFTVEERTSFGDFLTRDKFIDTFRHLYPKTVKYSYWNLRSGARKKN